MKHLFAILLTFSLLLIIAACAAAPTDAEQPAPQAEPTPVLEEAPPEAPPMEEEPFLGSESVEPVQKSELIPNTILYQGHASIRITTPEDKIIYIDPWGGNTLFTIEGYDLPADLILVTHEHGDHSEISIIKEQSPDCQTITWSEAILEITYTEDWQIKSTEYDSFDLGFVKVEATAGCHIGGVSYLLTLSNGKKIWVGGDVEKMDDELIIQLAAQNLDYAFFSCDGSNVMDTTAATAYAARINAKHSIPYHTTWPNSPFDLNIAEQFQAEGRIIMEPGDIITIE